MPLASRSGPMGSRRGLLTGNQLYYLFGLSVLLVYLCLAGQYESWILPLAVLSAVPLALLGPVVALTSLGVANNLYTQIGLILMIALSAKNGILIVEVAREGRIVHGKPILEAGVEASRIRFRPILMTSFAFGMGVLAWCWRPAPAPTAASRWG
jgi:hydrophobic/amphiphilic exporter-1 (mainly G- bacteria), HAE1 family